MTLTLTLMVGCGLSGCAPQPAVRISVIPDVPAELDAQVIETTRTVPGDRCALPCVVRVAKGTTHRVTLRATGYYPARFELPYSAAEAMRPQTRDDVASLVIPLQPRVTAEKR